MLANKRQRNQNDYTAIRSFTAEISTEALPKLKSDLLKQAGFTETAKSRILLVHGSGSYATEITLRAAVPRWKGLLIVDYGEGEGRVGRIAAHLNIPSLTVELSGKPVPEAYNLEETLKNNPAISTVVITGMKKGIEAESGSTIIAPVRKMRRTLIIDHTSGFSATNSFDSEAIHYYISTLPRNEYQSEAYSFVVANQLRLERIARLARNRVYGPF